MTPTMSKTSAKANPVNQDTGDHNRGAEPGQEQQSPRSDRQNTAVGTGTRVEAKNQGRADSNGATGRNTRSEKGDSRRSSKR